MTWNPEPTVTIAGNDYTGKALNGVSINYGRSNVWEQPRTAFATIELINLNDVIETFNLNDTVIIKLQNSSGIDKTVFTGTISDITNLTAFSSSQAKVSIHRISALGPFAKMARAITSGNYPKEYDDDRMDRIFTAAGVTVDIVDTPGIYEFTTVNHTQQDCYSLASYYASMAFGYIYETTDGKVGFANESRRTNEADDNGYFEIPSGSVLTGGVTSNKTFADLANDIKLEYKSNATKSGSNATSISNYGNRAMDIITELEQGSQAQDQLDRYLALRSIPRTSLSQFTVQLDVAALSTAQRNTLIEIYMGKPIQVQGLPSAIYNGTYKGFVEGWNLVINRQQASLTIISTEAAYSLVPERWQDVNATLAWSGVGAAIQWQQYE
ncbi:MAG: hypothetical protein EB015_05975 [Methylocystaceae bacterium]|nr:hypothetical protein [Methylocystaceae bacterium]